jgi:uncharacterized membrane protein YidH (DUF202 family)
MNQPMSQQPGGKSYEQEGDRWLARERTELAWTRSSIAFLAFGVAVVKFAPFIGIPLLVFSAAIWLISRRAPRRDWDGSIGRRLLLVSVAVTGLAVLVLILTLVDASSPGLRR